MGAINFSLDTELLAFLLQKASINIFIETGTYLGDTVNSVSSFFKKIISIELSEKYYQEAQDRFKEQSHIQIFQGNSSIILSQLNREMEFIKQPILFWLDAHWCASEGTAGQQSQCPLLDELIAIDKLHPHSFILIDDARYFFSAPSKPNEYSQWPYFDIIISQLRLLSDAHEIMVFNDVIIYYPREIRVALLEFTHYKGVDWLSIAEKSRNYDFLLNEAEKRLNIINELLEDNLKKENMIHEIYNEAEKRLNIINELLEDNLKKENMIHEIYNEAEKRLNIIDELDNANKNFLGQINDLKMNIDNLEKINKNLDGQV
jgi:hypothetical protein